MSPGARELALEIGQELVEHAPPAHQQAVDVTRLGHAGPRRGTVGEPIALEHRDARKVPRQHVRRQQTGESATDDDGVLVHYARALSHG
jgi:hypothetical protein